MRSSWLTRYIVVGLAGLWSSFLGHGQLQLEVRSVATQLFNPRGVVVLSPHELIVVEAGHGQRNRADGKISRFTDHNQDGDFKDAGERSILLGSLPSYNGLYVFGTGHDEVGGAGDLLSHNDTLYFTLDNPQVDNLADGLENDIRITSLRLDGSPGHVLIRRDVTLNGLELDPETQTFYVVESGTNSIIAVRDGAFSYVSVFLPLAHMQQAVPAAVVRDPGSGDLLVALFSGQVPNGEHFKSYHPGDSKIVRIDAQTGQQRDEITGLTTAVDLAINEHGDIFVLELTSGQPLEKLNSDFDLYSPHAAPHPGGYPRRRGRLTLYPKHSHAPVVLLEHLDAPTNLSYANGKMYISLGQGTPGRRVRGPDGAIFAITGEILVVSGF